MPFTISMPSSPPPKTSSATAWIELRYKLRWLVAFGCLCLVLAAVGIGVGSALTETTTEYECPSEHRTEWETGDRLGSVNAAQHYTLECQLDPWGVCPLGDNNRTMCDCMSYNGGGFSCRESTPVEYKVKDNPGYYVFVASIAAFLLLLVCGLPLCVSLLCRAEQEHFEDKTRKSRKNEPFTSRVTAIEECYPHDNEP